MKILSHEFRASNLLNDMCYINANSQQANARVPLTCLIKFLGFKILCVSFLNLKKNSLAHGPTIEGMYKQSANIIPNLKTLCH